MAKMNSCFINLRQLTAPATGWLERLVRWLTVMPTAKSSDALFPVIQTPVQVLADYLARAIIEELFWMGKNLAPRNARPIVVATAKNESLRCV